VHDEEETVSEELALRSTVTLLSEARAGNERALEVLFERHRTPLRNFAARRMPDRARDLVDTEDLVQETLARMLPHLERFEPDRPGAFQAYLRRGLLNLIIDHQRRTGRKPPPENTVSGIADWRPTPVEEAIGSDTALRYENALRELELPERTAIIARIELGLSYRQTAEVLNKPSADAARMAVSRALYRLANKMKVGADDPT